MKTCWTCKYFYEKCVDCKNKEKWELWEDGTNRDTQIFRAK